MIDFHDPTVQRIGLKALPLTLAVLFLAANVCSIIVRSIRGPKDWMVYAQIMVKTGIIAWFTIMAINFWGGPTSHETVFNATRGWIGIGSLIGLPIAYIYLYRALRDEWAYWRKWWHLRRAARKWEGEGLP